MTEAPPQLAATPELLETALEQLRLEGAIFFRSELTEPFAFESVPLQLADALHPGADPLFDPAMRALPPAFVVRLPDDAGAGWVRASITYALEHAVPSNATTNNPITTRLPELVLIEVLRVHLASAPAADRGWLAALRDPVIAPAL